MNNTFFQIIPKKTFILILVLIVLIGLLSIIAILSPKAQKNLSVSPGPVVMRSPIPANNLSPLQKTITGKTSPQEIEQRFNVLNKQSLDSDKTSFTIPSSLVDRPDQIITQNNQAIFERTILIRNEREIIKISSIISRFGPPERILTGSKYYGRHTRIYVYANKGFAFIAITNEATDEMEIYEIHAFVPTSVENYLKEYGEDILLEAPTFEGE